MKDFEVGQTVLIPCSVAPGAFAGEVLVTIDLDGEKIAGFVKKEYLAGNAVRANIIDVGREWVTFRIPGSFFTRAAGRTRVPTDWANANLELVPA